MSAPKIGYYFIFQQYWKIETKYIVAVYYIDVRISHTRELQRTRALYVY